MIRAPKRPRRECLLCGRSIALRHNGRFYPHRDTVGHALCPGSGFDPDTLRDSAYLP